MTTARRGPSAEGGSLHVSPAVLFDIFWASNPAGVSHELPRG